MMELLELYNLAESMGIEIDEFQMRTVCSQSQMEISGACHVAMDTKQLKTRSEEKTALAHELGHCTTGSFYNIYSTADIRGLHERRANRKAANMLVPLNELIDAFEEGHNNVYELAEHFEVTEDFMRYALELYEQDLRQIWQERHGE